MARWVPVGVAGFVAVCLLAMGCAPAAGGPPGPTTTTSTTLPWTVPTGQWSYLSMNCSAYVINAYYPFTQDASVNIEAPASVQSGETFYITLTPGEFGVPTEVQGYATEHLRWMTIRYPLPANVQFVDSVMSAGFNIGPGYPSLSIEGDFMVYRVNGPFVPGDTVQMPRDRLEFIATGPAGSTIETRMHSLANVAQFALGSASNTCFPSDPGRVFSTTVIT